MAQATLTENVSSDNAVSAQAFPVLSIVQGHPRASSLTIAEHFEKRHKDVLRSITQTCHNLPESFRERNFALTSIQTPMPSGGGVREDKAYLMTRDGFTVVVMGFTGKKALEWKLRYIEAFNRMEAELARQAQPEPQPIPAGLSTTEDRKPLRSLINAWSVVANLPHAALYAQVRANFNLSRIDELPAAWIPDALAFVQARIDAGQPKALPKPEPEALPAPAPGNPLPLRQILDDLGKMMSMARKIDAAIYNRTLQIGTFAADRSPAQAEADRHIHGMPGQMLQSGVKMIEEGVSFLHRAAEGAEAMVALSRREVR